MPFPFFSSSPFMFWYIAQVFLLLHICLSRDGSLEESILPKRVIYYPTQKNFSGYKRKNVVETFHNTMKTISPSFPINETDYRSQGTEDSRQSELSLKSEQSNDFEETKDRKRRGVESFDGVDEDVNIEFEPDGYSTKEIAKDGDAYDETSSDALLESLLNDILTERPTTALRKRALVTKESLPKESLRSRPSTEPSKTSLGKRSSKKTKDKTRGIKVWKLEEKLIEEKETVHFPSSTTVESNGPLTETPTSNDQARNRKCSGKKNKHYRKCLSESDDPSTGDTEVKRDISMVVTIESEVGTDENELTSTENILTSPEDEDIDQSELILSLLPYFPDDDDDTEEVDSSVTLNHQEPPPQPRENETTSGAPHFLVLCIFGALCLLGIALLIMGIYTIAIKYVDLRRYPALKPAKDTVAKKTVSKINLSVGLKPKRAGSNPQDVGFLLHAFLNVLEKNPVPPNESLNQKYRSHAHFKAMKKISRKTKIY